MTLLFAVAIGFQAGWLRQGNMAIAIGSNAGYSNQGDNSIAIGTLAGSNAQGSNTIILNATGAELNSATTEACYIAPIRSFSNANILTYDTTSKEVTYVAKTFVIDHPTNTNKYLVHACLEGPEAGVYYRGSSCINDGEQLARVALPDYALAVARDFTVSITPKFNGKIRTLNASHVHVDGTFDVHGEPGPFDWFVMGLRHSIQVEPDKSAVSVRGDGPYRWLGECHC
jgi:hypothetical protein